MVWINTLLPKLENPKFTLVYMKTLSRDNERPKPVYLTGSLIILLNGTIKLKNCKIHNFYRIKIYLCAKVYYERWGSFWEEVGYLAKLSGPKKYRGKTPLWCASGNHV